MNKKKKGLIISGGLILLSILFTFLVKNIDVQAIGPNESSVGFAWINNFVFGITGVNMIWYTITDWLGFIPIIIALIYSIIGFIQLIKRKSLLKVDKEILILGAFYIIVISLYVMFEVFIINYRPTLMNGFLEASYPSSHTLLSLCICGSSVLLNKKIFSKKQVAKVENLISIITMVIIVIGRFISGVHWFTDIIGAIIISSALLMTFYSALDILKKEKH